MNMAGGYAVQRPKSQISQKCCVMAVGKRESRVARGVGEFARQDPETVGGGKERSANQACEPAVWGARLPGQTVRARSLTFKGERSEGTAALVPESKS